MKYKIVIFVLFLFVQQAKSEDLLSVYHDAITDDVMLEQARESVLAVMETKTQANSALYLPEAHLNANVYGDSQSVLLSKDSTGLNGRNNFMMGGYSLTLTQPILHYDRIIGLQQTEHRIAQANTEYAAAEIALLLRIAERYFDVLSAQENLQFTQLQEESLLQGLKETKLRESAGYLAMTDVQEAQAGYDRAIADKIEAEHQLKDAYEGLREITGKQYNKISALNLEIPLVEPNPFKEEIWINKALTQNLKILALQHSIAFAKEEIQRQESGHFPSLDAIGNHSFSTSGGRFGSADIEDTTVGLSLNVPIYQGGIVNSKVKETEHRYKELLAKLKLEERAVQHDTSKAFLGVTAGISRIKAFKQNLHSSEAAVAATRTGFRVGRRTALDVIVAEREQFRAQRDYAKARYDYVINTLRLKQSVGVLNPEDLGQINHWLEPLSPK